MRKILLFLAIVLQVHTAAGNNVSVPQKMYLQKTLTSKYGFSDTQSGLINMNARLYDPILGRFLSPDPYVQAPDWSQSFNRYSYAANNPMLYVDENGEFFFTAVGIGVLLNAACWGAAISAAAYTASVAFSDGGFNNWNWGQFGKSLGIGAVSGFVTGGLGQAFGPIGNFGHEVSRAYFHGFANGAISTLSGGDFLQGFASGGLGSLGGSAFQAWGGNFAKSAFGTVSFSAVSGGIGSVATGGNFWQGAATGAIVGLLNHAKNWSDFKTNQAKIQAFLSALYEAAQEGLDVVDFNAIFPGVANDGAKINARGGYYNITVGGQKLQISGLDIAGLKAATSLSIHPKFGDGMQVDTPHGKKTNFRYWNSREHYYNDPRFTRAAVLIQVNRVSEAIFRMLFPGMPPRTVYE